MLVHLVHLREQGEIIKEEKQAVRARLDKVDIWSNVYSLVTDFYFRQ